MSGAYAGDRTTGFASPASDSTEGPIDLSETLDLHRSNRYPVRVVGDALDAVNGRYGRGTVRPLSTGLDRTWRARQAMLSPAYTTRLQDIMEVKAW